MEISISSLSWRDRTGRSASSRLCRTFVPPGRRGRCRPNGHSSRTSYYSAVAPYVGALIPKIYHYDSELYCTVMERLSPHIILRHGLIAGRRYNNLARDIGEYIARACFFTSDLARPFERKMDGIALFAANKPLMRITRRSDLCGSLLRQRAQSSHLPAA